MVVSTTRPAKSTASVTIVESEPTGVELVGVRIIAKNAFFAAMHPPAQSNDGIERRLDEQKVVLDEVAGRVAAQQGAEERLSAAIADVRAEQVKARVELNTAIARVQADVIALPDVIEKHSDDDADDDDDIDDDIDDDDTDDDDTDDDTDDVDTDDDDTTDDDADDDDADDDDADDDDADDDDADDDDADDDDADDDDADDDDASDDDTTDHDTVGDDMVDDKLTDDDLVDDDHGIDDPGDGHHSVVDPDVEDVVVADPTPGETVIVADETAGQILELTETTRALVERQDAFETQITSANAELLRLSTRNDDTTARIAEIVTDFNQRVHGLAAVQQEHTAKFDQSIALLSGQLSDVLSRIDRLQAVSPPAAPEPITVEPTEVIVIPEVASASPEVAPQSPEIGSLSRSRKRRR